MPSSWPRWASCDTKTLPAWQPWLPPVGTSPWQPWLPPVGTILGSRWIVLFQHPGNSWNQASIGIFTWVTLIHADWISTFLATAAAWPRRDVGLSPIVLQGYLRCAAEMGWCQKCCPSRRSYSYWPIPQNLGSYRNPPSAIGPGFSSFIFGDEYPIRNGRMIPSLHCVHLHHLRPISATLHVLAGYSRLLCPHWSSVANQTTCLKVLPENPPTWFLHAPSTEFKKQLSMVEL